jgi:hypothetical protein
MIDFQVATQSSRFALEEAGQALFVLFLPSRRV